MSFERRRAPRYQIIADAEIIEHGSKNKLKARTSDVSLVGCFMHTKQQLPAGAQIHIRVTYQENTFVAEAKVARSEPAMGIGVSFEKIKTDQQNVLQSWLADFSRSEAVHQT